MNPIGSSWLQILTSAPRLVLQRALINKQLQDDSIRQ